jgi:hypothetical protein
MAWRVTVIDQPLARLDHRKRGNCRRVSGDLRKNQIRLSPAGGPFKPPQPSLPSRDAVTNPFQAQIIILLMMYYSSFCKAAEGENRAMPLRPRPFELLKRLMLGVAFLLWGVVQLMLASDLATELGNVVIALYVVDLGLIIWTDLQKNELETVR